MTNPWDKIFIGDFKSAHVIADQNYLQFAQDFDLRARAMCSLMLRQCNDALTDFLTLKEIEKQTDRISDGTFLNIALCYYAMAENEKAVEYFKFPITNRKDIRYTIDISVPASILFYIAIKLDRDDILKIATKELKRLKQTIPLFLLGQLRDEESEKMFTDQTDETLRNRKHCKVEFYKGSQRFKTGNLKTIKDT